MNNRIRLMLEGRFSKGTVKALNKQIKNIEKNLNSLEIDSSIIADLKKLEAVKIDTSRVDELTKSIKVLQEEVKELSKTQKKTVKEMNEESIITPTIDDKSVKMSLKQLRDIIKKNAGSIKYEVDTTGAEDRIKKLTATFDKFGQKRVEVFKPADVEGKLWKNTEVIKHDSVVKETTKAYQKLKEEISSSHESLKITDEQFASLSRRLERFGHSKKKVDELTESFKSMEEHNRHADNIVRTLEKLVSKGKLSNEQMAEQKQIMNSMGDLNKKKYESLRHSIDLTVQSSQKYIKQLKEEQKELEKREKLEQQIQGLKNKFIHMSKYKPTSMETEEYGILADNLKKLLGDNSAKGIKELERDIKNVGLEIDKVSAKATTSGRTQIGIIDAFRVAMEKFPIWMITSGLFYGTINSAKEFVRIIVDIDTKMTSLRKVVSDTTDFEKLFERGIESAEKFGETISDTLDSYIEFAKQGFEGEELGALADAAVVAGNVADMTSGQAAEYLTSSIIQWQKNSDEAMSIIDQWNEISNNFATTSENLAQGQARAGSVAKTMGMEFEELNGMVAVTTAMTKQSGNEIGNFIKTVLPRLTSAPAKKALEQVNVELTDTEGNIRNIIDIYKEVAQNMKELSSAEQTEVLEGLAGKYHISRIAAFISDLGKENSMYDKVMQAQADSTGSAIEENEEYLKSFEARIKAVRRTMEELSLTMGEAFLSDAMLVSLKAFKSGMEAVATTIEKFGALPLIFATLSTVMMGTSKNTRTFVESLIMGTSHINENKLKLLELEKGMTRTEVATQTLGRSLKGLAMSTGVGLLVAGLGIGIEKAIEKMGEAQRKSEELEKQMKAQIEDYSNSREEIHKNIKEVKKLEQELGGKNLSQEDRIQKTAELQNLNKQLSSTFPELIAGEDGYGQAIYRGTEVIESRIAVLEKQLELEKEKQELQEKEDRASRKEQTEEEVGKLEKQREKEFRDIQKLIAEYEKYAERRAKTSQGKEDYGYLTDNLNLDIKKYEDVEKLMSQLTEKQKELAILGEDNLGQLVESLDRQLSDGVMRYEQYEIEISSLSSEYAQARIDETVEKIKKSIPEVGEGLETLGLFRLASTSADYSIEEIEQLFSTLEGLALKSTEELSMLLNNYQSSLQKVRNSTEEVVKHSDNKNSEAYKEAFQMREQALKEVKDNIGELMSEIEQAFEREGKDLELFKGFEEGIYTAVENQMALAAQIENTGEKSAIALEDLDDLLLKEVELGEVTEEVTEKIEGLAGVMASLFGISDDLSVDDLNEFVEELSKLEAILPYLEEGTAPYNVALKEQDLILQKLIQTFPEYASAYRDGIVGREELIGLLNEEVDSINHLDAVIAASVEGRLNEQEKEVLSSFISADAKKRADAGFVIELENNSKRIKEQIEERKKLLEDEYKKRGKDIKAEDFLSDEEIKKLQKELAKNDKERKDAFERLIKAQNDYKRELEALALKNGDLGSDREKDRKRAYEKEQEELEKKKKDAERKRKEAEAEAKRKQNEIEKRRKEQQRAREEAEREAKRKQEEAERKRQEAIRRSNQLATESIRLAEEYARANETSSYVVDRHARAVEELNLALQKQQHIKEMFPVHSQEYSTAIETEIELEKRKLAIMEQQAKQQEKDLRRRRVTQLGVVDSPASMNNMRGAQNKGLSGWGVAKQPKQISTGEEIVPKKTYNTLQSNVTGIVKRAFRDAKEGNTVIVVDSKGNEHRFKDLSSVKVKAGQKVGVGTQLGRYREYAGLSYVDNNYSIHSSKGKLDPSKWIQNARSGKQAGMGYSTVGTITNASQKQLKEAQEMYQLETDILSLQGDIFEQHARIEKLQLELLNAELSRYDKRRDNYEKSIEQETVKYAMLDEASERYTSVIERQTMFLGYKQQVNQEELERLKEIISYGKLQGVALEEVKERYHNLTIAIKETTLELSNLKKEWIDSQMTRIIREIEVVDYNLEKLNVTMDANKEGSIEWRLAMESQTQYLLSKKSYIKAQIEQLSHLIRQSKELTPDAVYQYQKQLQGLTIEYGKLNIAIEENTERLKESRENASREIADRVINAYKNAIRERQDIHMKQLDREMEAENKRHQRVMDNYRKEMDEFRKVIDDKIKQMDREEREEDYEEEMKDYGEQRFELQSKINLLSLDDSREAKYERRRLEKELESLDKEIAKRKKTREKDLRKENLNEMLNDKQEEVREREDIENEYHEGERERIDKLREYWNQHYTDMLNDEQKFAIMREDIARGSIKNIEKEFKALGKELRDSLPELANTMDGTMQAVGTTIRENVINELEEAIRLLKEFDVAMNGASTGVGGSKVPQGKDPFQGIGGAQYDSEKGTWNTSYSRADGKVIVGKFMRDHLWKQEPNKVRQVYVRERGAEIANQGRAEGSKIDNVIRYDQLVKDMSPEDAQLISEMMEEYAKGYSSPHLRDYLQNQAKRLRTGASFDTGGYTGEWGGNEGRLALLHQQELVLNTKETDKFGNILAQLSGVEKVFDNLTSSNRASTNPTEATINLYIDIDKLEGDSKSVKKFGKQLIEELNREYGRR